MALFFLGLWSKSKVEKRVDATDERVNWLVEKWQECEERAARMEARLDADRG